MLATYLIVTFQGENAGEGGGVVCCYWAIGKEKFYSP